MPGFSLTHVDTAALEGHPGPVYAVDRDYRIAYANPAYFAFAQENGGGPDFAAAWGVGRSLLDAVPPALQPYFQGMLRRCLGGREVWDHEYECSSAERFRLYWQSVRPLPEGAGLLMVNALVADVGHHPLRRPAQPADEQTYADAMGLKQQCIQCRRFRRHDETAAWDWVPAWVKQPPAGVSFGFCGPCLAFYYPGRDRPQVP